MIAMRSIYYLVGILLSGLAIAMMVPCIMEVLVFHTAQWQIFALAAFLCGTVGSLLALANYTPEKIELRIREAFVLTSASWIILSLCASLPFYWSVQFSSFIDAWFEAVSALTTTGTTVMRNLDKAPRGILLWRAILQWLGGTGIIVMAMIILPVLHIGGMQLFRSEFSDRSEKILPRVSQISAAILSIYLFFTITCAILLYLAGMTSFDAICHAMTTVSTGGLSTHDRSLAYFDSLAIEMIVAFYMIIGGATFILFIKAWQGHMRTMVRDQQFQLYILMMIVIFLIMALWNWRMNTLPFLASLRHSWFCVVSFMTSTGFTTVNYLHWGSFPLILLFLMTLVGGCTGSTAGGIKIFRFQVMFLVTHAHLRQLHRPYGVYLASYQGYKIPEAVATSVLTFMTLYCLSGFFLACALAMSGMDFLTSLSAAMAAIGNTGPGITDPLGPAAIYQTFSGLQKFLLMGGMILGRLELLTILVLFMPSFWRS